MTKEELRSKVIDKYGDLCSINYRVDENADEMIEALAFLESIPDAELLSLIKTDDRVDDTMDKIEHRYIKQYEEFSKKYDKFIFNCIATDEFEDYIRMRFNITSSEVSYDVWR